MLVAAALCATISAGGRAANHDRDLEVALGLAEMLRAARTVISVNQDRINDPNLGDKGLSADVVIAAAIANFTKAFGRAPSAIDPKTQLGRLLRAQMEAIREVMDENQSSINRQGIGFKGFVPAVFARLVNERFGQLVGAEAEVKVTAPPELVRNRKARPDALEVEVIRTRFAAAGWPSGKVFAVEAENRGRKAFRVLAPEYYGAGCLACHGVPKGEMDVTGYPKEGGKLNDLGGVISITLFR